MTDTRDLHHRSTVKRLKTGAFERRFTLARTSLIAGTRLAAMSAGNWFSMADNKAERQRTILRKEAEYMVHEMGKLKGSVVKIGQMMALYGEHFLPPEITDALHTLNDDTTAVAWPAMESVLRTQLGPERLAELEINPEPIAAASLGQVHTAIRKHDGKKLCLKIQYPGVADAIDSDLALVTRLLRLTRAVPQTEAFDEWLEEVRMMMHREVNYPLELETTRRFGEMLQDDLRYIVPQVFPEYSSTHILATSFEEGVPPKDDLVLSLPAERRNALALAAIDLCCKEVFLWGEVQTDPNFGNYLVLLGENGEADRLVLLDFGAVREFPEKTLRIAREMTRASFYVDKPRIKAAMREFTFMSVLPEESVDRLADVFFLAFEPFAEDFSRTEPPAGVVDEQGNYAWAKSELHLRAIAGAAKSATSRSFSVPPKEFMFLARKLIGVYTFLTVIDARIRARSILAKYI